LQEKEARVHLKASEHDHPGIIKLYQVVKSAEFTYFVLDYCPSGDLFTAIMTKRYYNNIPIIKSIISQVADALAYLHALNIFHRDLKPENVLITSPKGAPPIVALADFGLSCEQKESSEEVGTTFYMSPESLGRYAAHYKKHDTAKADVWALGVLILALVLDRMLPWTKALDDCEAFRDFTFDTERWLMRKWHVSDSLNDLLTRIFELNPHRRIDACNIPPMLGKVDRFIDAPEDTRF
ncbi:kinase-like protein, partial [Clavulina sp. PMI_390]